MSELYVHTSSSWSCLSLPVSWSCLSISLNLISVSNYLPACSKCFPVLPSVLTSACSVWCCLCLKIFYCCLVCFGICSFLTQTLNNLFFRNLGFLYWITLPISWESFPNWASVTALYLSGLWPWTVLLLMTCLQLNLQLSQPSVVHLGPLSFISWQSSGQNMDPTDTKTHMEELGMVIHTQDTLKL